MAMPVIALASRRSGVAVQPVVCKPGAVRISCLRREYFCREEDGRQSHV